MKEQIKTTQTINGNTVYGFNSENVYYSVTVDHDKNYWLQLSGHYHFGNHGLHNIVKHIEAMGIHLKENITAQKYFASKRKG